MTNAITDNSISTQNVVLWQYDKAEKFCAVVDLIETWGKKATEAFWNYFVERVHGLFRLSSASDIDDFSLSLWGIFVGLSRPTLTVNGLAAPMSRELYRKCLAARLKLLQTNGSLRDISQYCADIFGTGKVTVTDGLDMSISYGVASGVTLTGELLALYDLSDYWQFYPAGVRDNEKPKTRLLAFRGQYMSESGVASTKKTKPNFFSGTDEHGVDWKGVFHPKTRSWSLYDDQMNQIEGSFTMSYSGGAWTLSMGGHSVSQFGMMTSVWHDYGVYFVKGSGTGGTYPENNMLAIFR